MIIRADVKHKDGTSDRHYIKFELINEYVDRFVYVYELQMEQRVNVQSNKVKIMYMSDSVKCTMKK